MYNFILEISLMLGLGTMIYLVARAVPRVGDEVTESTNTLDKWISSLPLEKIDVAFSAFLEKVLRRLKLVLMRLDNVVSGQLDKVKKFNKNGQKNGEVKPTLFNGNSNGGNES